MTNKASEILKNSRIDSQLSLEDIAHKTKIAVKYLRAIEEGDCQALPSQPYCTLYVGQYARLLGLDEYKLTSLFKRDLLQKPAPQTHHSSRFYLTPQFIFSLSIGLVLVTMFTFLVTRYLSFNQPPKLEVFWPDWSESNQVKVSGKTDPNCSVRVNEDLIIIETDGSFSKIVDLSKHPQVTVESTSPYGKKTNLSKNYAQTSN